MSETHTAPNLRQLLTATSETVERPVVFPDCWLWATCLRHRLGQLPNQNKTDYVDFYFRPDEVHPDTSEEAQTVLNGIKLSDRELSKRLYVTPAALFMISDMLDGVFGKDPGRTLFERIPEMNNTRVIIHVYPEVATDSQGNVRVGDDGEAISYTRIRQVMAA